MSTGSRAAALMADAGAPAAGDDLAGRRSAGHQKAGQKHVPSRLGAHLLLHVCDLGAELHRVADSQRSQPLPSGASVDRVRIRPVTLQSEPLGEDDRVGRKERGRRLSRGWRWAATTGSRIDGCTETGDVGFGHLESTPWCGPADVGSKGSQDLAEVGRGLGCWRHRLPHRQPESRSLRHWTNARSAPSLPCGGAVDGSTLTEARPPRRTRQHATPTSGAGSGLQREANMNGVTQPPLPAASLGLDDVVVVVTGGASGIGRVTAGYLVGAGARVVLVDTDAAMLEAAVDELAASDRVTSFAADTTDEAQMDAAVTAAVERFGRLDGLVACAGIRQISAPALDVSWEVWSRVLDVNLRGTLVAARAAGRVMVDQGAGVDRHGRIGGRRHPPYRPGGLRRQQGGSHPGHPCAGPRVRPVSGPCKRGCAGDHPYPAHRAGHPGRGRTTCREAGQGRSRQLSRWGAARPHGAPRGPGSSDRVPCSHRWPGSSPGRCSSSTAESR